MDMRLGGGVMDAVNEGQKLIIARTNLMSPLSMEAPGAST
jgi:hypothetical protein